jgi:tetratricopeptide (TPR) repeat protein
MRFHGPGRYVGAPVLLLFLLACQAKVPAAHTHPVDAAPRSGPERQTPRSLEELGTTDGAIAATNLLGQIRELERLLAADPSHVDRQAALAGHLSVRAQFLGLELADHDRVLALADALVSARPKDSRSFLVRAGARAALHRFAEARLDLEEARRLGASSARVDELSGSLALATGQLDEALARARARVTYRADVGSLGQLAVVLCEMGRHEEAGATFLQAQERVLDPSPFPVAWLYFQEGLMAERAGRPARARELYEAAHERLPAYASVTSHLAGVLFVTGEREAAVKLQRSIVSDDPEYIGQLAGFVAGHDAGEAATLRENARARFEALVATHPEAFADHAARFYLSAGADPRRALELAELNRAARTTGDSLELLIQAALAAKETRPACAVADRARAFPYLTPALLVAMSRAYSACDRPADAVDVVKHAGP